MSAEWKAFSLFMIAAGIIALLLFAFVPAAKSSMTYCLPKFALMPGNPAGRHLREDKERRKPKKTKPWIIGRP